MVVFAAKARFPILGFIITGFILTMTIPSFAYLTSDFDVNLGQSSYQAKFKVGDQSRSKTLDTFSALEMNYNLRNGSAGIAYSISFFEFLNSKEGYLTFTRLAGGVRWYPLGMTGGQVILDNDVIARIWKATPFFGFGVGVSNMSVDEFNAAFTDMTVRFGAELPLTAKINLLVQYVMAMSLSTSAASSAQTITYQGQSALLGIVISNSF